MDKEHAAISRLQEASSMSLQIYRQPLIITTSGGKDSSVCVALAERAGIPFEVMHNHTTADAPETVRFICDEFRRLEEKGIQCIINYPVYKGERISMWKLIPQKLMPPTRCVRYCCSILKETGGTGRFITTGVRWAESVNRNGRGIYEILSNKKTNRIILNNDNDDCRRLFENCRLKAKRVCNPIIDWTDRDVWDYIGSERLTINPLYQCGFYRVGCIGCPLADTKSRKREFALYPRFQKNYIVAFDRMLKERQRRGFQTEWEDSNECFHWWMEDGVLPGQISFYEEAL